MYRLSCGCLPGMLAVARDDGRENFLGQDIEEIGRLDEKSGLISDTVAVSCSVYTMLHEERLRSLPHCFHDSSHRGSSSGLCFLVLLHHLPLGHQV